MKHDLKIVPSFFKAVRDRSKTFEVRINDRGFQRGDTVVLREWNPELRNPDGSLGFYTEEDETFVIGYVLPIDEKRVVFSLKEVPSEKVHEKTASN